MKTLPETIHDPWSGRGSRFTRGPSLGIIAAIVGVAAVAMVAGVSRSPMSPVLPPGAGPLAVFRWPAQLLGLDGASSFTKTVAAFASVLIACGAFVLALWQAWRGGLTVRAVIIAGVAFHVVAVALPVLISHDVFLYAMYGRIASIHHANPYVAPPSRFAADPTFAFLGSDWHHVTTLYGPAFIQVAALFTRVFRSPVQLIWAFKALSGAASVGTMAVVASLARKLVPKRAAFAAAVVGLNPLVLFETVGGGHFDPIIGLSIALALWVLLSNARGAVTTSIWRELGATALLTIGALFKVPVAILVGLFVLFVVKRSPRGRRLARLAAHVAVSAGLALVFAFPFLQSRNLTLGLIGAGKYANRLAPASFLQFMLNVFQVKGDLASTTWNALHVGFALVFLLGCALLIRKVAGRLEAPTVQTVAATWAWILILLFLTVPAVWPWYVVWVLPLAWALPPVPRWGVIAWSIGLSAWGVIGESSRYLTAFQHQERFAIIVLAPGGLYLLVRLVRELVTGGPLVDGQDLRVRWSRTDVQAESHPRPVFHAPA